MPTELNRIEDENIIFSLRDGLKHSISPREKMIWIYGDEDRLPISRFAEALWRIYDQVNPEYNDPYERRRFLNHPYMVSFIEGKVCGGVWTDCTYKDENGIKTARIHVVVADKQRGNGLGKKTLKAFEQMSFNRYHKLSCGWDKREDCCPEKVFEKIGYNVQPGFATKEISNIFDNSVIQLPE